MYRQGPSVLQSGHVNPSRDQVEQGSGAALHLTSSPDEQLGCKMRKRARHSTAFIENKVASAATCSVRLLFCGNSVWTLLSTPRHVK